MKYHSYRQYRHIATLLDSILAKSLFEHGCFKQYITWKCDNLRLFEIYMTDFLKENINWVNKFHIWKKNPLEFSKIFFNRGATSLSLRGLVTFSNNVFHDKCMSLVILMSVLRLLKVSLVTASMLCCYCLLFHHFVLINPHYHSTMITRTDAMFTGGCQVYFMCHLSSPLQLGFAPIYASSFLTPPKCNEYR